MKKFFKIGKKNLTPESSPKLKPANQQGPVVGYDVKEKDLGKLHKAVWNADLNKVKQLAKKDASPLDKENRYMQYAPGKDKFITSFAFVFV